MRKKRGSCNGEECGAFGSKLVLERQGRGVAASYRTV